MPTAKQESALDMYLHLNAETKLAGQQVSRSVTQWR